MLGSYRHLGWGVRVRGDQARDLTYYHHRYVTAGRLGTRHVRVLKIKRTYFDHQSK